MTYTSTFMTLKNYWLLLGLLILALPASAWPVGPRPDSDIMNEAQFVVIARVKPNSLKNLSHKSSFETQAVLLVTRALKGNIDVHELPIMIAYGVLPVPKGNITKSFGAADEEFPFSSPYSYNYSESIPLFEFNPDGEVKQVCDDIRKEQIWFLRPYHSIARIGINPGTLGVLDFRDVQPLSNKDKFEKILK